MRSRINEVSYEMITCFHRSSLIVADQVQLRSDSLSYC